MDISDHFANPNPDGQEWIKRKIMNLRWELRRTIEETEFVAEQYQMKMKYHKNEDLSEMKHDLKELFEKSFDLATQIQKLAGDEIEIF